MEGTWFKDFNAVITVCDKEGKILDMNKKSCLAFEKYGGSKLVGTSVLDCHPEPARKKLEKMLETGAENCYTTEKNGVKKLVYQSPWFIEGEYMGFVEIIIELPVNLPNIQR